MLIGIPTSPRPKSYLADTIRSIQAATTAHNNAIVVSPNFRDPNMEIVPEIEYLEPLEQMTLQQFNATGQHGDCGYGAEWHHRGVQKNTDRLMRELCDINAPFFVVMQDDAVCAPRTIDRIACVMHYMQGVARNHIGAVSFYSPYIEFGLHGRALVDYPEGKFYGEICLLWRREAALEFLGHSNWNEAHDLEIQRFFRIAKHWRLMAHFPCLCQHVGVESARGDAGKGCTSTPNFYNVDAMAGHPLI